MIKGAACHFHSPSSPTGQVELQEKNDPELTPLSKLFISYVWAELLGSRWSSFKGQKKPKQKTKHELEINNK